LLRRRNDGTAFCVIFVAPQGRLDIGDGFEQNCAIARQHFKLIFIDDILKVRECVFDLSHMIFEITMGCFCVIVKERLCAFSVLWRMWSKNFNFFMSKLDHHKKINSVVIFYYLFKVLVGVLIWEIFSRKSSLNERMRANFMPFVVLLLFVSDELAKEEALWSSWVKKKVGDS
jgi:hypothetical protein